jgi:hypothetical protein
MFLVAGLYSFHKDNLQLSANIRIFELGVSDWYGKDIQSNIKCQHLTYCLHILLHFRMSQGL